MNGIDLAYFALGTVFVFFGLLCCATAVIRKHRETSVLIWLGIWSAMYGTNLLLGMRVVFNELPHWGQVAIPFLRNAFAYLLLVAGLLVWAELTVGKMRRLTQWMAIIGTVIALGGIGEFLWTNSGMKLILYNNLLVVFALLALTTVVAVPKLSRKYLLFPHPVLAVGTLAFAAEALFRNISRWLALPNPKFSLLDEFAFALFLFSFGFVAAQKVFSNERRLISIEKELEIARKIQISILPTGAPEILNLNIAAEYVPMTAIGGDFYEFLPVDERHGGFLMADVSGHGVPAALIASMLKVAMQSVVSCSHQPAEVLRVLNRTLSSQLRGQFITAAYLWLDMEARVASYSSAGHQPLLRYRQGAIEPIESNGLLFGVMQDVDYPECALTLESGDRFLLYTDGLVEPENAAGESFGDAELPRILLDSVKKSPTELLTQLLEEVRRWPPPSIALQDDVTLMAIDVA
jgi:sigma-B regulation protein RsbU (phosphoserine phosphatase)